MKLKPVVSTLLLLFVAVSLVTFIVQEVGRTPAAAKEATTPASAATSAGQEAPEHQVVAYYFYSDTRCPSCVKIESWSDEAITGNFEDELESGLLVWTTINTDTKGNEHYLEDYEIYTKSLVIADFRKGKQVRWQNLEDVWNLLGNQEEFSAYVVANVQAYLDGVEDEPVKDTK